MEKHNLIIILDDKITEIDAVDGKSASILTIHGEDNISLNGTASLDEAKENILEKNSLNDITEIELNVIIIDNGTKEEYISYLYKALKGANKINIIDASIVVPMLCQHKGLTFPINVALNCVTYSLNSDGMTRTETSDNSVIISNDDLLVLFNYYMMMLKHNQDITETIESLQQQHDEARKPAEQYTIDDNKEFKEQLKKYINHSVNLEFFSISKKTYSQLTTVSLCYERLFTKIFYKFSIFNSTLYGFQGENKLDINSIQEQYEEEVLTKTATVVESIWNGLYFPTVSDRVFSV